MLELLKNYIEKRISLLKLEMAENTTKAMSLALYLLLVLIFVACVFAFLFLGLALIIGRWGILRMVFCLFQVFSYYVYWG